MTVSPSNDHASAALLRQASKLPTLQKSPFTLAAVTGHSLNNQLWRVAQGDDVFALRVPATTNALGIDRGLEVRAARAAATSGVSPRVIDADDSGLLLLQWLDAREWTHTDLAAPTSLVRAGALVAASHVTPPATMRTLPQIVADMSVGVAKMGELVPDVLSTHLNRLHALDARARARHPTVLTHHDPWPNNILDDSDRLWLIDWEFAGAGDGMVDVAVLAMAAGLTDDDVYDGRADPLLETFNRPEERHRLLEACWSTRLFEAVWALAQHAARGSDGPFDYAGHSRHMFDILRGKAE